MREGHILPDRKRQCRIVHILQVISSCCTLDSRYLDHSREQHGLSSGHCSLVLQDGGSSSAHAAVAHNDASSSEEIKRTMVINMVYIIYIQ